MKLNKKQKIIITIFVIALIAIIAFYVMSQQWGPKISFPDTEQPMTTTSLNSEGGGTIPDQI